MKKTTNIILTFCIGAILGTGCSSSIKNEEARPGTQSEVIIGEQSWMAGNLNVSHFRNGDPIPEAKTDEEWRYAGIERKPAWCYYDNDAAKGEKYGKLYNWYAVNDPRGLAPSDFHIASDKEWTILSDYLGGYDVAGKTMKSIDRWYDGVNSTNASGFTGLPGGFRDYYGLFENHGKNGYWWSSSEYFITYAWYHYLNYYKGFLNRNYNFKEIGLSVRCVRD